MKRIYLPLIAVILLSACSVQIGIETPSPTPSPKPIETTRSNTDGIDPTATLIPTATAGEIATPTLTQSPTDTPISGPAEEASAMTPALTITPTAVSPTDTDQMPEILAFNAEVTGDTVTLTWRATNAETVRVCLNHSEAGLVLTDCETDLPLKGSTQLPLADDPQGRWGAHIFLNYNEPDSVTELVELSFPCHIDWAFEPIGGHCPVTPAYVSNAAAQPFENGWMLYLPDPGLFVMLTENPAGNAPYSLVYDPVEVVAPGEPPEPPEGFYAPVSGFGHLWRGEISGVSPARDSLGWALAPEFNYQATFQCDDAGNQWQTCYVSHPQGWTVVLDSLGRWYDRAALAE